MTDAIYLIQGGDEKRLQVGFEHSKKENISNPLFVLTSWGMNNTTLETSEAKSLENIALEEYNIPHSNIITSPIGIDRIGSFIGIREIMKEYHNHTFLLPIQEFHESSFSKVIHTLYPHHDVHVLPFEQKYDLKYNLLNATVNFLIEVDIKNGMLKGEEKQDNYFANINQGNSKKWLSFQQLAKMYLQDEVRKSHLNYLSMLDSNYHNIS